MAAEEANNQRLLRIKVLSDRVLWEVLRCEVEGKQLPMWGSDQSGIPLAADQEQLAAKARIISLLADLQQLVADMRRSASWDANVIDGIAYRVVEQLGEQLYRFLFQGRLADLLNESLSATVDGMLRIELEFQGEALERYGSWPWEYLRSPKEQGVTRSGQFLALCAQLMLNRRLLIDGESAALRTGRPVVLLIVAGPPNQALGKFGIVQANKVVTSLDALHAAKVIELVKLVEPEFTMDAQWRPRASWEAFKTEVAKIKPDVIHFIGHGERVYDAQARTEYGTLVFVGPGCRPDPRRDADFVQAVANSKNLKLVFLQACESGVPGPHASATSVGQRLAHHGIPAVVAMQAKVENVVANDFAEAFYKALSEHKPVDLAVREGREAIQNESEALKLAFGVPVLYLRSYEALIQRPGDAPAASKDASTAVPKPTLAACPRCDSADLGSVACPRCGLRLLCKNKDCSAPLTREPDPERRRQLGMQRFCGQCGTPNDQVEWTPTRPAPAEADALSGALPRVH